MGERSVRVADDDCDDDDGGGGGCHRPCLTMGSRANEDDDGGE